MVRKILVELEASDSMLMVEDPNAAYQVTLMKEAGLVEAQIIENGDGFPVAAALLRLTWNGHDFLDSSRDNTIWKKAMEHVIKPGASWSFSLLVEWLKQEAHQKIFGTPPHTG